MIFAPSLMFANFCFNYTTKNFSITIKMSQLLIAAYYNNHNQSGWIDLVKV